jgi:hypothetical protein
MMALSTLKGCWPSEGLIDNWLEMEDEVDMGIDNGCKAMLTLTLLFLLSLNVATVSKGMADIIIVWKNPEK